MSASLYYALEDGLKYSVNNRPLTRITSVLYTFPKPPLVSQPVIIKVDGNITGGQINYLKSTVVFSTDILSTSVVTSDYSFCTVKLYDDYPDIDKPDFVLPAVSLEVTNYSVAANELGRTPNYYRVPYTITVFAERSGQRDDITDIIREILLNTSIPLIDFEVGFPILSSGLKNDAYNANTQTLAMIECFNFIATPLREESTGRLQVHRMDIQFDAEVIT